MLDDLRPTGRSRANLTMEVAQKYDAVAPANPFLVLLEVLLGMSLSQQLQHLVGQLSQGQFFVARNLKGRHQALKARVPDVALRRRDLAAGEENHITARDQPV